MVQICRLENIEHRSMKQVSYSGCSYLNDGAIAAHVAICSAAGFSGHFRFAPFGAFYYWHKLVHTPVLYGADVFLIRENFIYDRAPRQAAKNLLRPGPHRSQHVPLSHATVACVT